MSKRPAEDSLPTLAAPAVRPTDRFSDLAAFAEAAAPDTLMRALVPNDVIDIVGSMLRGPRIFGLSHNTCGMFDTGSAEQCWRKLPEASFNGSYCSSARSKRNAFALSVSTKDWKNTMTVHTLDERTSLWRPGRTFCDDTPFTEMVEFSDQLFLATDDGFISLASVRDSKLEVCTQTNLISWFHRTSSTRIGVCVTSAFTTPRLGCAFVYDAHMDRWADLPRPVHSFRCHAAVSSADGQTVAVFSRSKVLGVSRGQCYDTRTQQWRTIAGFPDAHERLVASAFDDTRIIAQFEFQREDGVHTVGHDIHVYDIRADRWAIEPAWRLPGPIKNDALIVF